jgi:hypothetical protein
VTIILNPTLEERRKWGPLAYVSEERRNQILALPFGQFKPALKVLEREIAEARKPPRKKVTVIEYRYYPKPTTPTQPQGDEHESDPDDTHPL